MSIETFVSRYFLSTFVDNINVFDCSYPVRAHAISDLANHTSVSYCLEVSPDAYTETQTSVFEEFRIVDG